MLADAPYVAMEVCVNSLGQSLGMNEWRVVEFLG